MLAGNFEVRVVEPGAVTLTALGSNRTVVMKPRHTALRDHQGNSLDVWTICNVFVDGTHLTNGIVCEGSDDSVFVQLGS
jgi:hypothetical protein